MDATSHAVGTATAGGRVVGGQAGPADPLGLKDMRDGLDIRSVLDDKPPVNGHGRTGTVSMDKSAAAAASAGTPLQPGERPPFDPDAT